MIVPVVGQTLTRATILMAAASGLGGFVAALALAFRVGVVSSDNPTTKTVHKRIDDLQKHIDSKFESLNRRLDDTQVQVDRRFERINKKLDDMDQDIDKFSAFGSRPTSDDGYESEWDKWRDETRDEFGR